MSMYYSGGRRGYDREYRSYDPRRTRSVSEYDYAGRRRNKYVMSDAGSDRYVHLFCNLIIIIFMIWCLIVLICVTYDIDQIYICLSIHLNNNSG